MLWLGGALTLARKALIFENKSYTILFLKNYKNVSNKIVSLRISKCNFGICANVIYCNSSASTVPTLQISSLLM